MLHLHFANRYETLTRLLLARVPAADAGPFASDTVIVPSAAVRRSLTLALADAHGLCANVEFPFLAQWLWKQIGRVRPEVAAESPFTPALLTWRIYRAFADNAFVAAHPRLAGYIAQADDVMRHDLARRVAALFDQYVTYRADWLEAWQTMRPARIDTSSDDARADERWQAALWQRITGELGVDALHPAQAFVDALDAGGAALALQAGIPPVVHVFALPAMAPLHLGLLQQLGRWIELHLYVVNPCREYWFELIDRRRLSYLAARGRAEGHEEGNRLLAAWGQQTQAHIDALVEAGDARHDAIDDDALFEPDAADTLLAQWHNRILDLDELAPGSVTLGSADTAGDRSIEVHVCHSLTRELEALHDHLLGLFASSTDATGLQPSDILVVTPKLDDAAPLIDAVFGTAPRERTIPYVLSGRARSRVNEPARALLALLALAGSRFAASELFGLLQQPIVMRRFGLDDATLAQVHDWMRASGMRWALHAEHRASFDLPASARHTLADGLDRLFLGYAVASNANEPFADWLPSGDAEGSQALALGAFWRFADALQRLHRRVSQALPPAEWRALLLGGIDDFLAPSDEQLDDLRELRDAIAELTETMQRAGFDDASPLPLPVLRTALTQQLDDAARGGVPSGSVTFSSISSLRTLPFKVVCAIGLNDGAFPSAQRAPEFDLMAQHPRRGDRQRRTDERNLFLDLLLAARHSVYLSHTGRSVRDNAPLPPSVLVSELLDVLVPAIADDPSCADSLARARRRLVVEHPLQPFGIEGFVATGDEPRLRSFNRELGDALRHSLQAPASPPGASAAADDMDDDVNQLAEDEAAGVDPLPPFFTAPLPAPGPEWREVTLTQLIEFYRHPSRYLLRRRLGIDLGDTPDELEDDEPFVPAWSGRHALAQRLLPVLLQGADAPTALRLALAGTEMPAGALGRRVLDHELDSLLRFAAQVRAATQAPPIAPHQAVLTLGLAGESWQLQAGFADLRPTGLVRWRHDTLKPRDRIEAWLHHLMLCADPPVGVELRTTWIAADGVTTFSTPDDASELLHELLYHYRHGLSEPAHFFPKAAWAFVDGEQESLGRAQKAWHATPSQPFAESADAAYRLALRGRGEPLDESFADLARAVFGRMREHLR